MASTNAPAPDGLGSAGEQMWADITSRYGLRVDELRVLEDICREVDLIARLDSELAASKVMVVGSQGQEVINPLVSEVRQHRGVVARLLAQLKLPDLEEAAAEARSTSARAAANARWSRRGA